MKTNIKTIGGIEYVVEEYDNGTIVKYPKQEHVEQQQEQSEEEKRYAALKADMELVKVMLMQQATPSEPLPDMPPLPNGISDMPPLPGV